MQMTTLHEVEEALRTVAPDTLHEMAFELAHSHVRFCELTSQMGDCAHISSEETRDRVDGLEYDQLISLLAPTAWMSINMHRRLGI